MVACMFTGINCNVYGNGLSPTFTLPYFISLFYFPISYHFLSTWVKENVERSHTCLYIVTNIKEPWVGITLYELFSC